MRPFRSRIFRVAGIGPVEHQHRIDADRGLVEDARARIDAELVGLLRATSAARADAPSETWDELPAVIVPSSLNAGFSAASPSSVVSGRMPWSVV